MTGYRYWSPKRYGQQILFILLFPIIPIIKKTNIRPIIPNIRFSCQIFGQLFRLFIFLLFHKPCRFYRLSEYSSDYSFFYFFYVIYINNIHHSITSHPIAFNLLDGYCYKRPGRKNWDPEPAGSRREPGVGYRFFRPRGRSPRRRPLSYSKHNS